MNESNNVKFTEDNGKWFWKCYDTNGSVVHRSQLFETEKEAREDYEMNGGQYKSPSSEVEQTSTQEAVPANTDTGEVADQSNTAGTTAPEGDIGTGTAETVKDDQVNTEQTS